MGGGEKQKKSLDRNGISYVRNFFYLFQRKDTQKYRNFLTVNNEGGGGEEQIGREIDLLTKYWLVKLESP